MIKQQYKKIFTHVLLLACGAIVVAQFIPSSFSRINPPVTGEPLWDNPETRETFFRVCADCHSNNTVFPWYSTVAPASWIIESDVQEGRRHFNVSEWDRSRLGGSDAADEVRRGAMPVGPYLLMHPAANLNADEKKRFVDGLTRTFSRRHRKND